MDKFPEYNEEENLLQIKMDKNQTFVLVEGSYDVPIYDAALRSLIGNEFEGGWNVVYGGGKDKILKFIEKESCYNFIAALDRDFSKGVSEDERAFYLKKYSIENYFFCEKALSHSISLVSSLKYQEIFKLMSLEDLKSHYAEGLSDVYFLLKEYQAISDAFDLDGVDNVAWSEAFYLKNNSWELELNTVERIKGEIDEVLLKFNVKNLNKEDISEGILDLFPGKLIAEGVRRFVNEKLELLGKKRPYQNANHFKSHVSSMLYISPSFINDVKPAIDFVERRL